MLSLTLCLDSPSSYKWLTKEILAESKSPLSSTIRYPMSSASLQCLAQDCTFMLSRTSAQGCPSMLSRTCQSAFYPYNKCQTWPPYKKKRFSFAHSFGKFSPWLVCSSYFSRIMWWSVERRWARARAPLTLVRAYPQSLGDFSLGPIS